MKAWVVCERCAHISPARSRGSCPLCGGEFLDDYGSGDFDSPAGRTRLILQLASVHRRTLESLHEKILAAQEQQADERYLEHLYKLLGPEVSPPPLGRSDSDRRMELWAILAVVATVIGLLLQLLPREEQQQEMTPEQVAELVDAVLRDLDEGTAPAATSDPGAPVP